MSRVRRNYNKNRVFYIGKHMRWWKHYYGLKRKYGEARARYWHVHPWDAKPPIKPSISQRKRGHR